MAVKKVADLSKMKVIYDLFMMCISETRCDMCYLAL